MIVGCVREIKKYEYRVGLTPDNAREYIAHGHSVMIEKGSGEGSGYPDLHYEAAGATIVEQAVDVWTRSDMVIKVKEPLEAEYPLLQAGKILYTYLHLAPNRPLTDALLKSGTTGVAYETIRDRDGRLPLLSPMSEVAGRLSVIEGAKALESPMGGAGVLLPGVPGVPKGKVVILGGGVVGTNACKIAVGLGADVTVLDNNQNRLAWYDDVFGARVQTLYSTPSAIQKSIQDADLVIGAVLIPGASTPKLIKREYLSLMKKGSVIVDVAVDQGGCCETTKATYHDDPTYVIDGVIHYCVANMPGAVARTSTVALTNTTLSYGLKIADQGLAAAATADPGLMAGINTVAGCVTFPGVAESLGYTYTDPSALI